MHNLPIYEPLAREEGTEQSRRWLLPADTRLVRPDEPAAAEGWSGEIWRLPADVRLASLIHLARHGAHSFAGSMPLPLIDALGAALRRQDRNDIVGAYHAWVSAHVATSGRPEFDLSRPAVLAGAPRVLLISPVYRLAEASIGLVRIAFFLRGLGMWADWFDATPDNLDELVQRCRTERYDLIGQGTTHYTFHDDIDVVRRLAGVCPDSRFILGGHGAVMEPLARHRVLSQTPITAVVRGFGERSTARLASLCWKALPDDVHLPVSRIPGIYALADSGGEVETGVDAYGELEFRALHAVFDPAEYPVSQGVARFITSTHCPFACVFCSSKNFPEQPATRLSPGDVKWLVRTTRVANPALSQIEFNDDNFSIGYRTEGQFRKGTNWLEELCEVVGPNDLGGVPTYCYTRADTIDHQTLVALRSRLGLNKIGIGLEHVDHDILRLMKKGTGVDRVVQRIRESIALGIHTNFFVILFCKWETRDTLRKLLAVASRLCLEGGHIVYNWGFQPLGGAEIASDPTNRYIESTYTSGGLTGRYRAKIVPDDPFVGAWFASMNDRLDDYFRLQEELSADLYTSWQRTPLARESLWFSRVLRRNQNINLSDTLTNLIRIYSMFVFGERYIDPASDYFRSGAEEMRMVVQEYVYNGPAFPARAAITIEDKVRFLKRELPVEFLHDPLAHTLSEIEVAYTGLLTPSRSGIALGPEPHREWAEQKCGQWEAIIRELDPAGTSVAGTRARRHLSGVLLLLQTGSDGSGGAVTAPPIAGMDYIV